MTAVATRLIPGEVIEQARRSKGLTVAELADLVPVDRSIIGDWEHGRRRVPPERTERLAEILDVPADLLNEPDRIPEPPPPLDQVDAARTAVRGEANFELCEALMTAPVCSDVGHETAVEDFLALPGWMADGACVGQPLEVFFPERGAAAAAVANAKRICAGCPVRDACLAYAVEQGLQGVWGGTTERERRQRAAA